MKQSLRCKGRLLATLLFVLPLAAKAESQRDARLVEMQGNVWIKSPEADWELVPETSHSLPLQEGEKVKTGPSSEATIQLDKENIFELRANSEFEIISAQTQWTKLKLFAGTLLAKIEEKLGQNKNQINLITPPAVLAVRGTEFLVEIPKEAAGTPPGEASPQEKSAPHPPSPQSQAGLAVFEGSLDVTLTELDQNPLVRVNTDQEIDLPNQGPPPQARAIKRFLVYKKQVLMLRKKHARLRAKWRSLTLERRRAIRSKMQKRIKERLKPRK